VKILNELRLDDISIAYTATNKIKYYYTYKLKESNRVTKEPDSYVKNKR
jgi:hypothetical protein